MSEAKRVAEPAQPSARFTRALVVLSAGLAFLQLTILAPGDVVSGLGFSTRDLGTRWWAIATFTFVNTSIWPLLVNVGVLATFGAELERRWGTAEFLRYYMVCALGAWVAHAAAVSTPVALSGAAAPAMGSLLAFAAMVGHGGLFRIGSLTLSAGWLAAGGSAIVLATGVAAAGAAGATAYLAHVGGIVAGWAYLKAASSISFGRLRDSVSPVSDEEEEEGPPRIVPRAQPRVQRHEDDVVARSNAAVAREAEARRAPTSAFDEVRDPATLDRVLDKISQQGIESLTADERKLLDDLSRRLRDQ